jgi:anti-sigma regulatory factor (Ser/Thr protein kinase)
MVQDPPGDSTVAPDGRDDLRLEPVSVKGVGTVLVLDVRGRLAEAAEPAYFSVLLGLAEEPAAVVCDVAGVTGPVDPESVALLASLGVEVEQWPGVPIAVVCPDRLLREALAARPDSRHLMVESERQPVLRRLLGRQSASMVRMSLEPDPRSAGAAREAVARACDRWGMSSVSASATLVVSELVTNALPHAGSDVGLSVARSGRRLRIAVRDASSLRPQPQPVEPSRPRGRGLLLVAALADAWGVLPTSDGGKVVWAVLHD